jgi:hemoglobin/transferrin/lactoferrin receptor protein
MKLTFTLISLLFINLFGFSQIITVIDIENSEPLELATILSNSPKMHAITNINGQADISKFKRSKKIEIRLLGYEPTFISFIELETLKFKISLKNSRISIGEFVISATKWNQDTRKIPQKISVITAKQIALENPQTAADLLSTSGEVFIQKSQQGGGSPMIRGFSANRLLYSIDGVRMNTAIFRGGNLQNVISLDPFAIENTEVLFGPGSIIYGSDAIGGVMSFQTLTPQLSLTNEPLISGKASMRYSSANNENTGHFNINTGFKKWAFITSISSNKFGDLKMGNNGPDEYTRPFYAQRLDSSDMVVTNNNPLIQNPSGYSQMNLMQKIRFRPSNNWDLQYGFHYSETSNYSRYDRHIRYKNGLPRYGEWYYGPQKWMMNNLNISHEGNNIIYDEMTIRLAQQYFEESRISRDFNKFDRKTRIEKVNAYSANIDFTKSLTDKNTLTYGIEFIQNNVKSNGINEDISTGVKKNGATRYPQSTWNSYAFYLTDEFEISDKFLISAGTRYNAYAINAIFDTSFYPFPFNEAKLNNQAINGSIGAVYQPNKKLYISSNIATGFRSPNIDDMGKVFDSEPGAVVVPNLNLKAEYAYNAEISITKLFGEGLKIDATAYYTLLDNALVRRNYTLNGNDSIVYDGVYSQVQAMQNASVARVYGIQAGIDFKLISGFGFYSRLNIQKGEEELDSGSISPSRHAAPWFGISKLSYIQNKLNLEFYAQYSGKKKFNDLPTEEQNKDYLYAIDGNGNPYSPSWVTLNFKAMYKFAKNLIVSGGVENITDKRYKTYSSGLVSPGRNFILSLQAKF